MLIKNEFRNILLKYEVIFTFCRRWFVIKVKCEKMTHLMEEVYFNRGSINIVKAIKQLAYYFPKGLSLII